MKFINVSLGRSHRSAVHTDDNVSLMPECTHRLFYVSQCQCWVLSQTTSAVKYDHNVSLSRSHTSAVAMITMSVWAGLPSLAHRLFYDHNVQSEPESLLQSAVIYDQQRCHCSEPESHIGCSMITISSLSRSHTSACSMIPQCNSFWAGVTHLLFYDHNVSLSRSHTSELFY